MTRLRPDEYEAIVQGRVLAALGARADTRLFRNNRGIARARRPDGKLGRAIEFGLAPGASDLLGLVGPLGTFLSVEVKSRTGRESDEQRAWGAMVRRFGGIHILTDDDEDAVEQFKRELARRGTQSNQG